MTQKTRGLRDAIHMKKSCTLRRNGLSFSGDDGFAKSLLFGYLQIQEQIVTTTPKKILKINWKTDYLILKSKKTVTVTDYELDIKKIPPVIF